MFEDLSIGSLPQKLRIDSKYFGDKRGSRIKGPARASMSASLSSRLNEHSHFAGKIFKAFCLNAILYLFVISFYLIIIISIIIEIKSRHPR